MKASSLLALAFAAPALAIFQLGCGETCNGVIDGFELNCTYTEQHHGTSSDQATCQAESIPYLSTVAWCIHSRCADKSQKEILHYWDWVQGNRKVTWPSYESVLPTTEPPLVSEDMEFLESTVRITDESYFAEYGTQQTFSYVERWHVRTGYILIALTVASCTVGTAQWLSLTKFQKPYSASSWRSSGWMTWFKKNLVLPALFSTSHRQPVLSSLGYLPSRLMAVFLALFFILNIIFLAVGIKSFQPNTWSSSRKMEINNYVANRAGMLCFALLPLTVLLSARNNPLVTITRMSATTYIFLHRWVARVCALQAVIHSVGWTIQWYWTDNGETFRAEGTLPYMRWGFAGTVALCLMVGLAAWPVRHRSYELFIFLHIALGIVSLLGCWFHMDYRFANKYGYKNWLYVTFGIWGADRIVRSLRMLYLSWPALTQKPNTLAQAELLPGQSNLIKLTIPTRLALSAKPGQYAFVHFASLFKPWENHPFSIASWSVGGDAEQASEHHKASEDYEKNSQAHSIPSFAPGGPYITMMIRGHSGASGRIRDTILANRGPVVLPILLEGAYGHPQPLNVYETQVLIAGGVGVTAITGYIQSFLDAPNKTRRLIVVWSAREADLIQFILEHHLAGLPENVELRIHCTGVSSQQLETKYAITHGRPQLTTLVKTEVTALPAGERLAFFVSGSGSMSDEVRKAVVDCIGTGPGQVDGDRINFFDEVFAWRLAGKRLIEAFSARDSHAPKLNQGINDDDKVSAAMASRRESRMNVAQNDALMEFENFKKKYLLVNKHVTKLNSTLSVRIEELTDQVTKLQVENLRLRTTNISLATRLKQEAKGRDARTIALVDAATAEALRQLTAIRNAIVNPPKPSLSTPHAIPTPPSTSPAATQTRITGPVHPGPSTRLPVARAPEFPSLVEIAETRNRRRSSGHTVTDDSDSEMEYHARAAAARSKPGAHRPAPSYLESESEAEVETKARRQIRRQSGLVARGSASQTDGEEAASPVEPTKTKSRSAVPSSADSKRGKRKLNDSEIDDAIRSVGVIVDLPDEDDPVEDEPPLKPQPGRARSAISANKLQDVTNSPRRTVAKPRKEKAQLDDEPMATGYIGTPAVSKIKLPRARTLIPTPAPETECLTDAAAEEEMATNGRERRTRKSVNYAEPKLNTKMRKPTPDATSYGRFSLPTTKPRISTSIPRESSPAPESPMPALPGPSPKSEEPSSNGDVGGVTVRTARRRRPVPTTWGMDDDDAATEDPDADDEYVPSARRTSGSKTGDRRHSSAV